MGANDVRQLVGLEEGAGRLLGELEGSAAFGVEDEAVTGLGVDATGCTGVHEIITISRVRPENFPSNDSVILRIINLPWQQAVDLLNRRG